MKNIFMISAALAAICILFDSINSGVFNFGIALIVSAVLFGTATRLADKS